MSLRNNQIRGLAIAVIKNNGRILVSPGYDRIKDEHFYRLIGGGIEFCENSLEALRREFKEELGVEIDNCRLLATLENIFTFNGELGHEICFLYEAGFTDPSYYEVKEFRILDSTIDSKAIWLDINDAKTKKIFPEGVADFL